MAGAHLWSGSYRGGYSPSGKISFQQSREVGGTRYPWMTNPLPLIRSKKKKGQRVGQDLKLSETKIQKPEEIEAAVGKKPIRKVIAKIYNIRSSISNSKNPEGDRRRINYLTTNLLTCIEKTVNLTEERRQMFKDECLTILGRKENQEKSYGESKGENEPVGKTKNKAVNIVKEKKNNLVLSSNSIVDNKTIDQEKKSEVKNEEYNQVGKVKDITDNFSLKIVEFSSKSSPNSFEQIDKAKKDKGEKILAGKWVVSQKIAWSQNGKPWDIVSTEKDGWVIKSRKSTRKGKLTKTGIYIGIEG